MYCILLEATIVPSIDQHVNICILWTICFVWAVGLHVFLVVFGSSYLYFCRFWKETSVYARVYLCDFKMPSQCLSNEED